MRNSLESGAPPLRDPELQRALRGLAAGLGPLERVKRLRARLAPAAAAAAAQLAGLRERARAKLPHPERLFLTPKGLEQASPARVAAARAARIRAWDPRATVLDATAGIGGDSLALAAAGLRVVSADIDLVHACYLHDNLESAGHRPWVVVSDAARPALRPDALLIDPDRRLRGARAADRSANPARWSPPLLTCLELAQGVRAACIKLPPGMDHQRLGGPELERALAALPHAWCWVSLAGELKELALWTGELAGEVLPGERSVLALGTSDAVLSGEPQEVAPLTPDEARAVRWIGEPDPSVIRAGLIGLLARAEGLAPLGPRLAYLGGAAPPSSPLLGRWRVLACAPLDRRRVRAMLAEREIGQLTVKKRGHPDSAETLARRLRGPGSRAGTLIVARLARGHAAYLVERD